MKPVALYYNVLSYQPENLALIKQIFDVIELNDPRDDISEILANIEILFAPLGFEVNLSKMLECPKLRVIISNTTGIPHIDAIAAASRHISICALHDEQKFLDTITPTAEHTIGLMLAAWRRIPAAHTAACEGKWDRRPWGAPRMLSRMTLGIVGLGRLGSKVGRIAEAMGMSVRWFDPYRVGGEADLVNMARGSDVLSLHAPANLETAGLVSRDVLKSLPRGAMVINTARGELLDTEALIDLLESGHISAAALDTIEGEYTPDFCRYFLLSRLVKYARNHDNLILTPHIGGSTKDAWMETERYVVMKACRVFGLERE